MNPIIIYVAIFLISAVVFLFVGYILRKNIAESKKDLHGCRSIQSLGVRRLTIVKIP